MSTYNKYIIIIVNNSSDSKLRYKTKLSMPGLECDSCFDNTHRVKIDYRAIKLYPTKFSTLMTILCIHVLIVTSVFLVFCSTLMRSDMLVAMKATNRYMVDLNIQWYRY